MSIPNDSLQLPPYQLFLDTIAVLALPLSGSELHGVMCGYLCAGATNAGETYLRALTVQKKDKAIRTAALALFGVFAVSHHQMKNFDFSFQLLLPSEDAPLRQRAQAFGEWCDGFTQGMNLGGFSYEQLPEEEAREAMRHITEFAGLDYQNLTVTEEDEKALVEVSEYARLAVLQLYNDLQTEQSSNTMAYKTAH